MHQTIQWGAILPDALQLAFFSAAAEKDVQVVGVLSLPMEQITKNVQNHRTFFLFFRKNPKTIFATSCV